MTTPDRSTAEAALLLVKNVFGDLTESDARRLHHGNWGDYASNDPENPLFQTEQILGDTQKSELFLTTVDRVLESVPQRVETALRRRFGVGDGVQATLDQVGSSLGVNRERGRQILLQGFRFLRHPSRSLYLRAFEGDKTAEEISAYHQTLRPLTPHRSRQGAQS